ncbi:MAG: ATP-grasp domain-containing protein, partial [Gammaproteobacteria bacterium]
MSKALLIARRDSYRIVPYLRAAEALGIQLMVASNGPNSLIGAVAEGLNLDFTNSEAAMQRLLAESAAAGVDAVIPTDDDTIELTYRVAHALGLRGNPLDAARYSRRKDLARDRLAEVGVSIPSHQRISIQHLLQGAELRIPFPLVVKPLSLSGSRGVIRVDDAEALVTAASRIAALVTHHPDPDTREHLLLEAFVPGREVAFEGMLDDGELVQLALFDKPEPLDGPYFEETYYVMPSRLPEALQRRIKDTVKSACEAYGLISGPIHAELRTDGETIWVIEVAARTIGGQCARLLRLATGRGLEELVLAQAVGLPIEYQAFDGGAGVLMLPTPGAGALRRVEGVSSALKVPGVREVEISLREGAELIPAPEGHSYLGFVFATGEDAAAAEQSLRQAYVALNIVVGPLFKLR